MFCLCKDIRFKTTTNSMASFNPPALLLLLHKWFWLKLRFPGLTGGRTTWEVNRQWSWRAKASQWSGEDTLVWWEWFKPKRCFFEVPTFLRLSWIRWTEVHCSAQQWLLRTSCSKVGKKGFCEHLKSVRCKSVFFFGEVVWRNLGVSQCFHSAFLLNKTFEVLFWRLTDFSFKG